MVAGHENIHKQIEHDVLFYASGVNTNRYKTTLQRNKKALKTKQNKRSTN